MITKGRYLIKFLAYKQKIFNIYEVKIPSDIINMVLSSDRYCLVEVEEIEKFCCMRDNLSKKIFKTVLSDNVNGTKDTKELKRSIEKQDNKIVVITIQKLNEFVKKNSNREIYDKHCVIIYDECHR